MEIYFTKIPDINANINQFLMRQHHRNSMCYLKYWKTTIIIKKLQTKLSRHSSSIILLYKEYISYLYSDTYSNFLSKLDNEEDVR